MQKTCSSCGHENDGSFAFCVSCGHPLTAEATDPAGATSEVPTLAGPSAFGAPDTSDEQPALDPAATAAELVTIANQHPELRAAVAAHPNAYPELLAWLGEQGDPKVNEALAARPRPAAYGGSPATAASWQSQPAPPYGGQPAYAPAAPAGKGYLVPILAVSAVVGVLLLIGGVLLARSGADRVSSNGSSSSQRSGLYQACDNGDMDACSDLYYQSPVGSADEEFGSTCGDRAPRGTDCSNLDSGSSVDGSDTDYGDNAMLDALWDDCDGGDMEACDDLYRESPSGSEYEDFGDNCGGRGRDGIWCVD